MTGSSGFWFLVCVALIATSRLSSADTVTAPFYYASATIVDSQITTIVVGVNDVVGKAIVSGDRKYVTLNMDANLLGSQGIKTFTYQKSNLGFVGSALAMGTPPAAAGKFTPSIAVVPSEIAPAQSLLDKPGMVLIAPLTR